MNVAELVTEVCSRPGLRLARLPDDQQTMIVAYNGAVIGTVHTTTDSILHDWWTNTPRHHDERGPYLTARAAAVAMLPTKY